MVQVHRRAASMPVFDSLERGELPTDIMEPGRELLRELGDPWPIAFQDTGCIRHTTGVGKYAESCDRNPIVEGRAIEWGEHRAVPNKGVCIQHDAAGARRLEGCNTDTEGTR